MLEISVIIPIHEIKDNTLDLLKRSICSIVENQAACADNIKLYPKIICPKKVGDKLDIGYANVDILINKGKTDYCSQINEAVKLITTPYFAILEYDDIFMPRYFKGFYEYYTVNEDVSLFLPINVFVDNETNLREFCNEIVWAKEFSKERGYIDHDCLESFTGFNLTGGIFNRNDFIKVGLYKPSIKVAFNYELLLRLTSKGYKVYVVPKEGYVHLINAEGSLTTEYSHAMTDSDIKAWFDLAKCEFAYVEDREKTPVEHSIDELK